MPVEATRDALIGSWASADNAACTAFATDRASREVQQLVNGKVGPVYHSS